MHEEVSSSFMKQAQQYNALHHKVSSTKEGFERLCRENGERELQIRDRETELAYEDDVVKRLRTEHASLEEKNKRMRDQEEQLEATRKDEHRKYIETLDKCTRQMYASRQASSEACKQPELARQPGEDSRTHAGPPLQLLPQHSPTLGLGGSLAPRLRRRPPSTFLHLGGRGAPAADELRGQPGQAAASAESKARTARPLPRAQGPSEADLTTAGRSLGQPEGCSGHALALRW